MPVSKNRRRKSKKKASPARQKPPAPVPLPNELTGGFPIGLPGDGEEGALRRAQELVYDAWEAGTARERVRLARQALALSELCADAHVLLAENAARTTVEARDHYRRGVVAGEKALGPEAFERDAGRFWGILETRPYMRGRSGLADCLWALGERSAATGVPDGPWASVPPPSADAATGGPGRKISTPVPVTGTNRPAATPAPDRNRACFVWPK